MIPSKSATELARKILRAVGYSTPHSPEQDVAAMIDAKVAPLLRLANGAAVILDSSADAELRRSWTPTKERDDD